MIDVASFGLTTEDIRILMLSLHRPIKMSLVFPHTGCKMLLRDRLSFKRVIFSDDLSMQAAHTTGGVREHAKVAQVAGCDMPLVCNDRKAMETLLLNDSDSEIPQSAQRTG